MATRFHLPNEEKWDPRRLEVWISTVSEKKEHLFGSTRRPMSLRSWRSASLRLSYKSGMIEELTVIWYRSITSCPVPLINIDQFLLISKPALSLEQNSSFKMSVETKILTIEYVDADQIKLIAVPRDFAVRHWHTLRYRCTSSYRQIFQSSICFLYFYLLCSS